jgi:hypothetical protein
VAAASLLGAAVVAGLVGTLSQAERARQQEQRAATEALQAQRERDLALEELRYSGAADELLQFMVSASADKALPMRALLGRADAMLDKRYAADPALRGRLQMVLAEFYEESLEYREAERVLERVRATLVASRSGCKSARAARAMWCSGSRLNWRSCARCPTPAPTSSPSATTPAPGITTPTTTALQCERMPNKPWRSCVHRGPSSVWWWPACR